MLNFNPQTVFALGIPSRLTKRRAYVQRKLYARESLAKGSPARSKGQPRFPFVGYAAENPQSAEGGEVIMDTLPESSEPPES